MSKTLIEQVEALEQETAKLKLMIEEQKRDEEEYKEVFPTGDCYRLIADGRSLRSSPAPCSREVGLAFHTDQEALKEHSRRLARVRCIEAIHKADWEAKRNGEDKLEYGKVVQFYHSAGGNLSLEDTRYPSVEKLLQCKYYGSASSLIGNKQFIKDYKEYLGIID